MNERISKLKQTLRFGVAPAMATPLAEDGVRVNTAVLPLLVDFLIGKGVSGLFVGGTTGEGILLDATERMRLHEGSVTAAAGRVPVLLHVGANRLDTAVSLAQHAVQIGADAIVAITPTFYGMDEDSLAAYFHAVATAAPETPLLLYDIPHMAVNGVNPALFARLGRELPSLAGIKTSRPDAQIIRQHIAAAPERAVVLAGNERIALGSLAMGADGLISGLSTAVPEPFVALAQAVGQGNLLAAQKAHQTINRLLDEIAGLPRIGAVKRILAERGVPVGTAVPPRPMPSESVWNRLEPLLS